MRTILHLLAVPALIATLTLAQQAQAQTRGRRAPEVGQTRAFAPPDEAHAQWSRTPRPYSAPPGYQGLITSTTPNEWGNFGGPSTGGGGGSGGP